MGYLLYTLEFLFYNDLRKSLQAIFDYYPSGTCNFVSCLSPRAYSRSCFSSNLFQSVAHSSATPLEVRARDRLKRPNTFFEQPDRKNPFFKKNKTAFIDVTSCVSNLYGVTLYQLGHVREIDRNANAQEYTEISGEKLSRESCDKHIEESERCDISCLLFF